MVPPGLGGGQDGEREDEGQGDGRDEGRDDRGDGYPGEGRAEDREAVSPDITDLRARVLAAIPDYWATRAAFDSLPPDIFARDSAGDASAGLAIDRADQANGRAAAELIASIRGFASAMDAAERTATQGAAEAIADRETAKGWQASNWPVFPDVDGGRLYFVGGGPGGAISRDSVTVVRLSGWAAEMVGKMAGGQAGGRAGVIIL